jgi:uncharacterized protein (UPF0276 family)
MSARSSQRDRFQGPIPARAGIGLRACHQARLLREQRPIPWLEAHSENYFAAGGALPLVLERLRSAYALSFHGVGLGLGNADPIDSALSPSYEDWCAVSSRASCPSI